MVLPQARCGGRIEEASFMRERNDAEDLDALE
jgi:hypothetical protein